MPTPISADPLARLAEQPTWPSPANEIAAQDAVRKTIETVLRPFTPDVVKARSVLHGDWLHEPLHVVLTDVPVGSWTASVVFDSLAAITGSKALDNAADASVLLGLAGAVGASITGLNDWAEIKAEAPRRIGAMHALTNIAATGIFLWSALARRKGASRPLARSLAALGAVLIAGSAHLGGNMVYEHGIGVEAGGKPWPEAVAPGAAKPAPKRRSRKPKVVADLNLEAPELS